MSLLLSKNYGSSVTKLKTSVANFVLFLLSLWIVGGSLCNIFLSQGGGRTTAMLPRLRPGLLSRPPCLPHCHRPPVKSPAPLLRPSRPLLPLLSSPPRTPANPSPSSSLPPAPLPCPSLLFVVAVPARGRPVTSCPAPPRPAYCHALDDWKRRRVRRRNKLRNQTR